MFLFNNALKRCADANLKKDLIIKIGEDIFQCSKSVGCFISPKISRLLLNDPTIEEVELFFAKDSHLQTFINKSTNSNHTNHRVEPNFSSFFCDFLNGDILSHFPSTFEKYSTIFKHNSYNQNKHDNKYNKYNQDNKNNRNNKYNKYTENNTLNDNISFNDLIIELGSLLDNPDFYQYSFEEEKESTEITLENVFSRIKGNKQFELSNEKEFSYLSEHFYLIELLINEETSEIYEETNVKMNQKMNWKMNEKIKEEINEMKERFDLNDFEIILSNENLKIFNEDSFFNFVFSIITKRGETFESLFDYIEYQYLNSSSMQKFISYFENKSSYSLNSLNSSYSSNSSMNQVSRISPFSEFHPQLLSSLSRRLLLEVQPTQENSRAKIVNIISYLTKQTGGNIVTNKTISVETSSVETGSIEKIFNDNDFDTVFRLNDRPNGFILIDFQNYGVHIEKYSFSVPCRGFSDGRPKSWSIEVSNDKMNWHEISSISNDDYFVAYSRQKTFKCNHEINGLFRYVRINEKLSQDNSHHFLLSSFELIGSIIKYQR